MEKLQKGLSIMLPSVYGPNTKTRKNKPNNIVNEQNSFGILKHMQQYGFVYDLNLLDSEAEVVSINTLEEVLHV